MLVVAILSIALNICQFIFIQTKQVEITELQLKVDMKKAGMDSIKTSIEMDRQLRESIEFSDKHEPDLSIFYLFCRKNDLILISDDNRRRSIAGLEKSFLLKVPNKIDLETFKLGTRLKSMNLFKFLVIKNYGYVDAHNLNILGQLLSKDNKLIEDLVLKIPRLLASEAVVIPTLPSFVGDRYFNKFNGILLSYNERKQTGGQHQIVSKIPIRPSYETFISLEQGRILKGVWW